MLDKVEIQNQLTWSKTILASRAKALEEETNYIDAELRSLQKKADLMHVTLYQCPKIKVRQLQPLDLNTGRPYATGDVEVTVSICTFEICIKLFFNILFQISFHPLEIFTAHL